MWAGSACKLESPLGLSPAAWWDLADGTTVFSDAGTTPAVDLDGIHQVNDKSGNGHTLLQATISAQPTYKVGLVNGRNIARADGTDDGWDIVGTFAQAKPSTIYIIYDGSSVADTNSVLLNRDTSGGAPYPPALYVSAGSTLSSTAYNPFIYWGDNGNDPEAYSAENSGAVQRLALLRYRLNGPTDNGIRQDKSTEVTESTTQTALSTWTKVLSPDGVQPAAVDFAELIVFDKVLSIYDDARVTDYLRAKWGLFA